MLQSLQYTNLYVRIAGYRHSLSLLLRLLRYTIISAPSLTSISRLSYLPDQTDIVSPSRRGSIIERRGGGVLPLGDVIALRQRCIKNYRKRAYTYMIIY